jgi:anion-transporting  ArsA/GET3 family ATPase
VLARAAADSGRRVLLVELDGKPGLAALAPELEVRSISAADALEEYLHEHGFRMIAKRLATTGVIDVVGTAAPGIHDLVVLGKVKQLERSGDWDLIVVDGPAAGHAVTFLTSAAGLRDAVRSGPVRAQADDVVAMLADPDRCQVVLVTVPETTPVNELLETAEVLRSRVDVRLGPVVVNQVDDGPPLPDPATVSFGRTRTHVADAVAAAEFRRTSRAGQVEELARIRDSVGSEQIVLPAVATAALEPSDIVALAASVR